MLKHLQLLVVIVVAAIVGWLLSYWGYSRTSVTSGHAVETQSAYERVIKTQTIRCGYVEWPPYYFKDENGNLTGLVKDVTDQIIALVGLKIEYIPIAIGNQAIDLQSNKIDSYCFDSPYTLAWLKGVDYSTPYFYIPVYIYGTTKIPALNDIARLNNQSSRFIGFDGDVSLDLAERFFPLATITSLPGSSDSSQAFLEVTTNKVDFFITDKPLFIKFDKNNPNKMHLIYDKPLATYPISFSVNKGEQKLLNTLSGAVEMAINMGIPERVLAKYDTSGGVVAVKPYIDSHE